MTDGIKSLLGDLVEQEMAAARRRRRKPKPPARAAGIGVYEARTTRRRRHLLQRG